FSIPHSVSRPIQPLSSPSTQPVRHILRPRLSSFSHIPSPQTLSSNVQLPFLSHRRQFSHSVHHVQPRVRYRLPYCHSSSPSFSPLASVTAPIYRRLRRPVLVVHLRLRLLLQLLRQLLGQPFSAAEDQPQRLRLA